MKVREKFYGFFTTTLRDLALKSRLTFSTNKSKRKNDRTLQAHNFPGFEQVHTLAATSIGSRHFAHDSIGHCDKFGFGHNTQWKTQLKIAKMCDHFTGRRN